MTSGSTDFFFRMAQIFESIHLDKAFHHVNHKSQIIIIEQQAHREF